MSSSKPSNHSNVALILETRGFSWESSTRIDEVIENSSSISFDGEWNDFLRVVQNIIDSNLAPDMNQTGNVSIAAEGTSSATFAWNCFKHVIAPSSHGNADIVGHDNENSFDSSLFEALRHALNGYVDTTRDKNWIVIKNSIVGFGRKVQRSTFGFEQGYALSDDSISDHGCFVLGTKAIKKLKILNANQDLSQSNSAKRRGVVEWFNDMTATVEIKLQSSSCDGFGVDNAFIKEPVFKKGHGPFGQAIMYSMDTWHCLARRGVRVQSIPVVVIAGKSNPDSKKTTAEKDIQEKNIIGMTVSKKKNEDSGVKSSSTDIKAKICCLEGHVQIPMYCGTEFTYSIDRIVSFNGTTGLSSEEALVDSESRDKRAVAIYIKTMRFGLENAFTMMCHRYEDNYLFPPVSLCCQYLLRSGGSEQLVASPIPCEEHQRKLELKISQGELFFKNHPKKSIFRHIGNMLWFVDTTSDDDILADNCLIKVACLSVHSFFVHPTICNAALTNLYVKCITDVILKQNLSKVLLGYSFANSTNCLISIMKDLRSGDKAFKKLEHHQLFLQGKLSKLWNGFCDLVNFMLLPMAKWDVIHLDIRSTKEFTYNILMHDDGSRIELCLIDFDGIALTTDARVVDKIGDNDAVWYNLLRRDHAPHVQNIPAYFYLFWQVLWIAYRWHPPPASCNDLQLTSSVNHFVSNLFKEGEYCFFKSWMGKHYEKLRVMNKVDITGVQIQSALNDLQELFNKCHSL